MEADSRSYLSAAASKRYQAADLQSQLDAYLVLEESNGTEDESRMEYACPFCPQDFDIVGLCCHIEDEHQDETKSGVCPLCAAKVGFNLVGHLTMQHASFFKMEHRNRSHKGSSESHSILSLLKKDLLDANLQSFSDESSFLPDNTTPDPLLSFFILNVPAIEALNDAQPQSLDEGSDIDKQIDDKVAESVETHMSDKDHKERALSSEFVRGLALSTIFEDSY